MTEIRQDFFAWLRTVHSYAPTFRLVLAVVLLLCGLFGARILRKLAQKLRTLTVKHAPEWLNILTAGFQEPLVLLLRVVCWYLAVFALPLPTELIATVYMVTNRVLRLCLIGLLSMGLWNSSELCRLLLRSAQNRLDLASSGTMLQFFERFYRALVLVFAGITILNELGFNVSALVTGAGLVGLTLSLAAQSTVSNLVAGFALVLEHPFGIGDYITVNQYSGTVEDISFRSTSIRTLDHALITLENSTVCSAAIQNIADRSSRLWVFSLGLTYDTPRARLESLCAALAALLKEDAEVLPDTVEITLDGFGDSSITVEVRCYVTAVEITAFRRLKDRLNREILTVMEAQGCDFAFPSTSVYMEPMSSGNSEKR